MSDPNYKRPTTIPLTIEAPGGKTEGVIVAIMVSDLDALIEQRDELSRNAAKARAALTQLRHWDMIATPGATGDGDWARRLIDEALGRATDDLD